MTTLLLLPILEGWFRLLLTLSIIGLIVAVVADIIKGKFLYAKRVLKVGGATVIVTLVIIFILNFAKNFFGI